MGVKLHKVEDRLYVFHCPGCQHCHAITVLGRRNGSGATWGWNGDLYAPTFSPSLNIQGYCHSFVKDGFIQYLNDCEHELKGKTVELPDWTVDHAKQEGMG
jgi:hypothetical protein